MTGTPGPLLAVLPNGAEVGNPEGECTDGRGCQGLLDASAVAELLQLPVNWVYAEARAGRLPHVRLGRYVRFRRESVVEWVAGQERGPGRISCRGGGP